MNALVAGLSILLAAPAPLRTVGEMSGEIQLDGELTEWAAATPTLLLDPKSQVAGPSKASSPADFSAKVWIAWGEAGLAIAGEVTDDAVRFAAPGTAEPSATADHVEIWLSLPAPALPPIAFVNQFAEQMVASAKA